MRQNLNDSFRIDVVLNFIRRFGDDQLYHIRDLLNQGQSQRDIAKVVRDRNKKGIEPSQLNRFIANTYQQLWVVKPGIVNILEHINEVRNARIEENKEALQTAILSLSGPRPESSSESP